MEMRWSAGVFSAILQAIFEAIAVAIGANDGLVADALRLLRYLGVIELVGAMVWYVFSDESDRVIGHLFGFLIAIGVTIELIANLVPYSQYFADGCVGLGLAFGRGALTVAGFRDPGAIMLQGWDLITPIWSYMQRLGWLQIPFHTQDITIYTAAGLLGWLAYLLIGIHVIVMWVELWVVAAFGSGLLPFLIWSQTRFIGLMPIRAIVQAGIRLGVLAALVALIQPVMSALQMTDMASPGYDTALALFGSGLLFLILSWEIPRFCANLAWGGPSYTFSGFSAVARTGSAIVSAGTSAVHTGAAAVRYARA